MNRLAVLTVAVGAVAGLLVQNASIERRPHQVAAAEKGRSGIAKACPWPANLDAVQAAPKIHRVIFENEHVRVLQVVIPPHSKEPIHTHCLPGTLYVQQAGDIVDRDDKGRVLFDSRQMKNKPKVPFVEWSAQEGPHSVENLDDAPLKLVRVENKD